MLSIGHFSFDEIDTAGQPRQGYFNSVVEADTPDSALAKFETYIRKMKDSEEQMVDVTRVYIEDILCFRHIPEAPIITRLQSSDGEFPPSISHSLPGVFGENVDAFGFKTNVAVHDRPTDGNFIEAKPLIAFDA